MEALAAGETIDHRHRQTPLISEVIQDLRVGLGRMMDVVRLHRLHRSAASKWLAGCRAEHDDIEKFPPTCWSDL